MKAWGARLRNPVALAIVLPALVLGGLGWYVRWTADDAFIHFRVVDQLMHGNGPVFNAGERVEASTSIAWVLILVVARVVTFGLVRVEYLALVLSLVATVGGLTMAGLAAARLAMPLNPSRDAIAFPPDSTDGIAPASTTGTAGPAGQNAFILVPFGSLMVVAVRGFWDYATSGLEMGLVFAWLAGCFLLMIKFSAATDLIEVHNADSAGTSERANKKNACQHRSLLILFGIGPLIRPDLGLFSLCFVGAFVLIDGRRSLVRTLRIATIAFAAPMAFQIFRMGYYAELVPNTAIAKSASSAQWTRGWHYLADMIGTYQLWLPLIAVAAAIMLTNRRAQKWGRCRGRNIAISAVLIGALLHILYIARVGGDFMHARLLLPAVFAIAMPVSVIRIRRRVRFEFVLVSAMMLWAAVSVVSFRFDAHSKRFDWIDDERLVYTSQSGVVNPVTFDDYAKTAWVVPGIEAKRLLAKHPGTLVIKAASWFFTDPNDHIFGFDADFQPRFAFSALRAGAASLAAGPDVYVIDRFGLADPVASHFKVVVLSKPGHDKFMNSQWVEGRFASAADVRKLTGLPGYGAQLVHNAVRCTKIARLVHDVSDPLTFTRFFDNFADAAGNTALEIPTDAQEAVAKFCPRRRPK